MTRHAKDWLMVFGVPLALFVLFVMIASRSATSGLFSVVLLIMGGTLGVHHGLTSPYFTDDSRIQIILLLIVAVCLVWIGWYFKRLIWGKCLVALGFYLWCGIGFIILGMTF